MDPTSVDQTFFLRLYHTVPPSAPPAISRSSARLIRFSTDTIGKFDLFDGCICHCGHCSVAYICDSDLDCIGFVVIDDTALLVVDFRNTVNVNLLLLTLEVLKLVGYLIKCEVSVCIM